MIRNSEIKGIIIRVLHSLVQDQSSPCTCQGNLRKHRLVTLGTRKRNTPQIVFMEPLDIKDMIICKTWTVVKWKQWKAVKVYFRKQCWVRCRCWQGRLPREVLWGSSAKQLHCCSVDLIQIENQSGRKSGRTNRDRGGWTQSLGSSPSTWRRGRASRLVGFSGSRCQSLSPPLTRWWRQGWHWGIKRESWFEWKPSCPGACSWNADYLLKSWRDSLNLGRAWMKLISQDRSATFCTKVAKQRVHCTCIAK